MAINFCPVNANSVDAFCTSRRAIVLGNLINQLRPPQPVVQGGVGRPGRDWTEREDFTQFKPTELEAILVTVEFNGLKMQAYQEVRPDATLVFASNLEANSTKIDVNIENLMINPE